MRTLTCGLCLAALLLAAGFALPSGLLAHTGATGVVKERMELMKSVGAAMKVLAKMFKGEEAYDPDAVRKAATQIQGHGGQAITKLFPADGRSSGLLRDIRSRSYSSIKCSILSRIEYILSSSVDWPLNLASNC